MFLNFLTFVSNGLPRVSWVSPRGLLSIGTTVAPLLVILVNLEPISICQKAQNYWFKSVLFCPEILVLCPDFVPKTWKGPLLEDRTRNLE